MSRSSTSSGSTTRTRGRGTQTRSLGNVNKTSREPVASTNTNSRRARPIPGRGMWNPSDNLPNRDGAAGRGRGIRPGNNSVDESASAQRETEGTSSEQQQSYCGAYSMLTPNEARRQKITSQAERETQQYEAYKEKNKLKHVSYVGTVGGGEKPEAEARREAQQKQANAKFQRLQKQQQWRDEKKREEESTNEQKKMEARKQAELKEEREKRRAEQLREDMRRKRGAFLDKLESQKPAAQSQPVQSPVATEPTNPKPQHRGAGENGGSNESLSSRPNRLRSQPNPHQPSLQPQIAEENLPTDFEEQLASDFRVLMNYETNTDVEQLSAMFPTFSPEFLSDILQQTGSLDVAASLLMEMQE